MGNDFFPDIPPVLKWLLVVAVAIVCFAAGYFLRDQHIIYEASAPIMTESPAEMAGLSHTLACSACFFFFFAR